ncbi:Rha family transcriptional regulator [Roseomonas mucosa]|uniref:Rha family transcriptional regulator n=1 Tax=Roseomonas mucosa TaxID=207340 RepID=UPI0030D584B2
MPTELTPIVHVKEGRTWADSRDVATFFQKQHKDVLKAVRNLHCSAEFLERNFAPFKIKDLTGESTSHYEMTKSGFAFLVMGFTGEEAGAFKEAYIARFDAMEDEIRHSLPALAAKTQGGITKAVIGKAISELVESTIAPLAEQVRTLIIANDARVAVVDYRPMLSALIDAGVEPKRRRALSQRCSKRCIAWLVNSNRGQFIRESRETGRMLFQVDALNDWMKAEGKTLIRAHLDRLAGQTVINFPKKV